MFQRFRRFDRLLCASAIFLTPAAASAGVCTDKIVALELAQGGPAADDPSTDLPETVGARLHHQPTEASVANAEDQAKNRTQEVLARARQLDLDGKEAECLEALKSIAPPADAQ
jgi:hypothetical protein